MGWHNTHSAYLVRQSAGNAVANGLPKTASIAAITSNPAEIFKLNYSGNIREGEVANLVLWSGDPFELTTEAEMVIIAGEKIEMISRSLQLRDRYYENIKSFIETNQEASERSLSFVKRSLTLAASSNSKFFAC